MTLTRRYFSTTTGITPRTPTPPMPRINYMVQFHNDDADFVIPILNIAAKEQPQGWFSVSNILLFIGWSMLSVTLLDLYLQGYGTDYYYTILSKKIQSILSNYSNSTSNNNNNNTETTLDKDEMMKELMNEIHQKRQYLYDQYVNTKPLYQCKVTKQYKMGGSHGLYNDIQYNDIVDVLVENVGPKQAYHLCRFIHPPSSSPNTTNDDDSNNNNNNIERVIMKDENGNIIELGWYPVAYLEKINPTESSSNNNNIQTRPWWKKWIFPFL